MLATLFGKKKLTEDKAANIFVNSLIQVVENSFPDIVDNIKSDGEFIKTPLISKTDSDKFLMIVLAGNLKYLSRYLSSAEEIILTAKIIEKFGIVFGLSYAEMKAIVDEYSGFIHRVNHPSRNTLYGMSKAVFFKYKLGQYQDEYFSQLNAPSPILLKRMDNVMENFLWDWDMFFDKYKFNLSDS